jgi:C_GCAxxG_C_C family probable redox protein
MKNKRPGEARELFTGPYNCAQSVASVFADKMEVDKDIIMRMMSGFGFGMGGERSVCGALSGGIAVISATIEDPAERTEIYDKVYHLIHEFKKHNEGKIHCLDLIGENPGDKEFQTICPVLVETVARLVEKIIARG